MGSYLLHHLLRLFKPVRNQHELAPFLRQLHRQFVQPNVQLFLSVLQLGQFLSQARKLTAAFLLFSPPPDIFELLSQPIQPHFELHSMLVLRRAS